MSVIRLSSVYHLLSFLTFFKWIFCRVHANLIYITTWTLRGTLTFAVGPHKVLWNILEWFGLVVSSIISELTYYISKSFICVYMADEMICNKHICVGCGVRCWWWVCCRSEHLVTCPLGRWWVASCVLYRTLNCRNFSSLSASCRLFGWGCAYRSWGRRRSVDWDIFWYPVSLDCYHLWRHVDNLEWSDVLRQQFRSWFIGH